MVNNVSLFFYTMFAVCISIQHGIDLISLSALIGSEYKEDVG